jgi:hypothetical protein
LPDNKQELLIADHKSDEQTLPFRTKTISSQKQNKKHPEIAFEDVRNYKLSSKQVYMLNICVSLSCCLPFLHQKRLAKGKSFRTFASIETKYYH